MIPIVFLLLLMMAQPAILLYDRMVMENAAAEACRLVSTYAEAGEYSDRRYQEYVQRRLASVPPIDIFHVSPDGEGWQIILDGGDSPGLVKVTISHRVRPLPLIGWGAALMGMTDGDGYMTQEVKVSMPNQPPWATGGQVGQPSSWPTQWED